MKRILKLSGLALLLLFILLIAKASLVKSRQQQVQPVAKLSLDEAALVSRLSSALQIQTVSYDDPARINKEEFLRFHTFLEKSFPLTHSRLTVEKVKDYSLLYRWEGRDVKIPPAVLMAHMDVVPAEGGAWKYPPFSGTVADGYIWGRGTLDDKSCVISLIESVEHLLAAGFQPRQTIYFAFGHDEETGGQGAMTIAKLLETRGVRPSMVLDEGGAILDEMIPGVVVPTAMIGTSEKGYLTLDLSLKDPGGHSSAPPASTAIGRLSRAVQRLEDHPMPAKLDGSIAEMLDFLAPEMPFLSRFFLANRWFFQPLIKGGLSRVRITNASVRTTTAVTMIEGGVKENVLPSTATVTVNFRIRPGETMEDVVDHVRKTIADDTISISRRPQGMNPSPVSSVDAQEFLMLQRVIRKIFPQVIVVPGIVIGATDVRHFSGISRNLYRFAPFRVGKKDFEGVHGENERIAENGYADMVRFYVQLIKEL